MVWNFLFWHLEDLAAAQNNCDSNSMTKTLQGLIMGIQCFGGEVPFFFFSGKILKKIGHISAMNLVLIGFALRFYLYSILTNPWYVKLNFKEIRIFFLIFIFSRYVLPIEFLNGITFGIFYSTMASYAKIISPNGTESTLQVIFFIILR
jgi:MFS_1 like family